MKEVLHPGRARAALPQLSPGGEHIAVVQQVAGSYELFLTSLGPDNTQLSSVGPAILTDYWWSPDGQAIFASVDEGGAERNVLVRIGLDGATKRLTGDGHSSRIIGAHSGVVIVRSVDPDTGRASISRHTADGHPIAPQALVTVKEDDMLTVAQSGEVVATTRTADGSVVMTFLGIDGQVVRRRVIDSTSPDDVFRLIACGPQGSTLFALLGRSASTTDLVHLGLSRAADHFQTIAHHEDYDIRQIRLLAGRPVLFSRYGPGRRWSGLNFPGTEGLRVLRSLLQCTDDDFDVLGVRHDRWIIEHQGIDGGRRFSVFFPRTGEVSKIADRYLPFSTGTRRRAISVLARDGVRLDAFLTSSGEPDCLPLVLLIHGGPWACDHDGFDIDAFWLAALGYACLQVNFRGSTGRGDGFRALGNKQWGTGILDDLVDAVAAVRDNYGVSAATVAMGSSFGGLAALLVAAREGRALAGAVAAYAPTNLVSLVERTVAKGGWRADLYRERIGDPSADRAALWRASPVAQTGHIECPILLASGQVDARVGDSHDEFVSRLRMRGVAVDAIAFANEGHLIQRDANRRFYEAHVARFLADVFSQGLPR